MSTEWNFPTFNPEAPMFGDVDESIGTLPGYEDLIRGFENACALLEESESLPTKDEEKAPLEVSPKLPVEDVQVKEIPEPASLPEQVVASVLNVAEEVVAEVPKPPVVRSSGLEFIEPKTEQTVTPQQAKQFQSVPVDPVNQDATKFAVDYLGKTGFPTEFLAEFEKQALIYGLQNLDVLGVAVVAANAGFQEPMAKASATLKSEDFAKKSLEFAKTSVLEIPTITSEEDVLNLTGSARRLKREAKQRQVRR